MCFRIYVRGCSWYFSRELRGHSGRREGLFCLENMSSWVCVCEIYFRDPGGRGGNRVNFLEDERTHSYISSSHTQKKRGTDLTFFCFLVTGMMVL